MIKMMKKGGRIFGVLLSAAAILFFTARFTQGAEVEVPDYPTIKISSIPENFQANNEITLMVEQEGFTGTNLFTNWCIDEVPLNSFYAGANDKIMFDEIQQEGETVYVPKVQGEYGRLIGGNGFCKVPLRSLNGSPEDFMWWAQTNVPRDARKEWFMGVQVTTEYGRAASDVIPAAAKAVMVGLEDINFLEPDITDESVYSPNDGKNPVIDDLLEDTDLPEGSFRFEGDNTWYISTNQADINNAKEILSSYRYYNAQDAGAYTNLDTGVVYQQILIKESYQYFEIEEVSDISERIEANGYEAIIRWSSRLEESGEGEDETIYKVKVNILAPPNAKIKPTEYDEYFEAEFGQPTGINHDNIDSVYLARYFNKLFEFYRNQTWDQGVNLWNDGRRENKILMTRIFHRLANDDDGPEGRIFMDKDNPNNPENGLPSYKDRDNDGIPDLWEMKMFGSLAGKKVVKANEKKAKMHFPPCCTFSEGEIMAFLLSVSPTDDWDADGFDWKNRAYREWSSKLRRYSEPWAAGLGPYIGRHKLENQAKGAAARPGDKKFTNYEEFVAGTNPTEVDTDGDGVPDELDFYGMSQETIKIKLNKKIEDNDYLITARAYGPINRGNYKKQPRFGRADSIRNIKQTGELPLEIIMAIKPDPATLSDEITVSAGVGNVNVIEPKLLFFQWYLNDIPIQSPPGERLDPICPCTPEAMEATKLLGQQSGYGKSSLTFPASLGASSACNAANILLEVTDPSTKQTTTSQIQVPIKMSTILTKSIKGNVPNTGEGVGEGVSDNDQSVEDVSPDDVGGVRNNDLIEITANLLGYRPEYCGTVQATDESGEVIISGNPEEDYMNSLTYIWTLDGTERSELSGKGRKIIEIKAGDLPRVAADNRGTKGDSNDADNYEVKVEVYDEDKNLVSRAEDGLKVLAPYIEFDLFGVGVKRLPTGQDGKSEIQLLKNSNATLRVNAQYLKPATDYVFTWTRHNTEFESVFSSPIGELNFIAGGEEGFAESEEFSVVVTSRNEKGEEIESVSKRILMPVVEDLSFADSGVGGFIGKLFPKNLRGMINFSAGFSLIALIMIFAYGYQQNKK